MDEQLNTETASEVLETATDTAETESSAETSTETVEESTDETTTESTEETVEESDDELVNSYVDKQAELLKAADETRYNGLVAKFQADEPFEKADVVWMKEVTGLDEATLSYGIAMQRELYRKQLETPDPSISEAEAEVGDIDSIISFARANAPAEKFQDWNTVVEFAKRTRNDAMIIGALKEMKEFQEASRGKGVKTLGHLASSVTPTTKPVVEEQSTEPVIDEAEVAAQAALKPLSSQALARIATNTQADPASRARAIGELKRRGILND